MATQGMQAVTSQAGHASQIEPLIYHYKVSDEFCKKVREITQRLEMPAEGANWLMAAMNFETGGTFSPGQKNGAGSGATGLIQFMPSTAKLLGTTTEKLAQMDAVAQLDYVEKYFESYKGKIHSLDDLYLVIFYPAALNKSDDFVLGSEKKKAEDREKAIANIYNQNKGFDYKKNGGNEDHQIQRGEVRGGLIRTSYEQGLAELGRPVPSTTAQNKPAQTTATTSGGTSAAAGTHIVGSGDTLSKIAKMYNVAGGYQALAKYNNISNPSRISIGQVIKIPGAATQTEQPEQKTELENPTTSTETAQTTQAGVSAQSGVTAISEKGYVSGTSGNGLKVRKGGSTDFDKIGLLSEGQAVEIIGQASTGWYQIKYGNSMGFVSNKYIKLGEAPKVEAVPAAQVGDAVPDQKLADNSRAVARELGTVGYCARGVRKAVQRTYGFDPGGNGNSIAPGLLASGKYKQINMSLADALKIPGLIFSWQKTSTKKGKIYGHTAISQGNGKSSTCDFYENDTLAKDSSRFGMTVYSLK